MSRAWKIFWLVGTFKIQFVFENLQRQTQQQRFPRSSSNRFHNQCDSACILEHRKVQLLDFDFDINCKFYETHRNTLCENKKVNVKTWKSSRFTCLLLKNSTSYHKMKQQWCGPVECEMRRSHSTAAEIPTQRHLLEWHPLWKCAMCTASPVYITVSSMRINNIFSTLTHEYKRTVPLRK